MGNSSNKSAKTILSLFPWPQCISGRVLNFIANPSVYSPIYFPAEYCSKVTLS